METITMTAIQKFHFIVDVHKAAIQIARHEKPTGDYPEWCNAVDLHFNNLAREYGQQARQELGIIRAEQAVR